MADSINIPSTRVKRFQRLMLSLSNVSRTAFISLVGLFINYVLLNYKANSLLEAYVYCISLINLFLVFCNWGGKDYNTKLLVAAPDKLKDSLNAILSSRLLLFLPALLVVCLIPGPLSFKLFIAFYLLLKVSTSVFESVITVQKKFHLFLLIDFCLNLLLLLIICTDRNVNDIGLFLAELLGIECIRLLACLLFFKNYVDPRFNFKKGFALVSASKNYFFIALAGFICSKADLYAVGLTLHKGQMSTYFIILNLVGLSQIGYATLVSTFSSNIFRYTTASFKNFASSSLKTGLLYSILSTMVIYLLCNYYYHIRLDFLFTFLVLINLLIFTMVLIEMYNFTRMEKQHIILKALIIAGVLNITLSPVLCFYLGLTGAFLSNTLGGFLTLAFFKLNLYYARD